MYIENKAGNVMTSCAKRTVFRGCSASHERLLSKELATSVKSVTSSEGHRGRAFDSWMVVTVLRP